MDFADPEYTREVKGIVRRMCAKYGLAERFSDALLTRDAGDAPRRPPSRYGDPPAELADFNTQGRLFA